MAARLGSFHLLVAKNVKILRLAVKNTHKYLESQLPASVTKNTAQLQPLYARATSRQPIHPAAFLRQTKRWFSGSNGVNSSIRQFSSGPSHGTPGFKYDRASFPKSRVASAINLSTGRAPFASTLRPNLSGGAIGRTAGGYGLGSGRVGGARFFSHTPAAQAQVIQNVNQAIRAFLIGGKSAQYDGVNPRTGEKRYKTVTVLQEKAAKKMQAVPKATPGSFIDFTVNPTITALTPLSAVVGFSNSKRQVETLNTEGLMDILSVDFSRSLKELAIILNDLKRLTSLGDLPITYQDSCLRIHFPGCDADTVERLMIELGIQRGIVKQDQDFDAFNGTEIALLFPFAPSQTPSECSFYEKSVSHRKFNPDELWWNNPEFIGEAPGSPILGNLPTPDFSTMSDSGMEFDDIPNDSPWLSSPSEYESFRSSEIDQLGTSREKSRGQSQHDPLEYQGIEGIYRFIQQCDDAGRQ
ncbi:hypothetical protein EJ08DRAFT_660264 [Tothia fuscella]|uniref:Casein kinase II beta 2 subunit n=1 Tax=Tothia fuscella TaxID=1048955 RepID=A0A9P4NTU9_9PEZI|nr:hypothetical protein EJ08DRAFT_660264 [Tothia fuscella]